MTAEEQYREIKKNEYNIFIKTVPRNVEKFANVIGRDYIFDRAFPLFGFKFVAHTACSVYNVQKKQKDITESVSGTEHYSFPGRRFLFPVVLYDENGVPYNVPMDVYARAGSPSDSEVLFKSIKNFKVKAISFIGEQSGSRHWEDGTFPIWGWVKDLDGTKRRIQIGRYYWFHEEVWSIKISDIYIYENPVLDSGMRIAGKNGKIYTPAESAFPSPLRIFHKRQRNIMLVPTDTQYASIFKIRTKDGVQAITTLT